MSDFHTRIFQLKKILDRVELLVIKDPDNILKRQMLDTVLNRYKKALKGEQV